MTGFKKSLSVIIVAAMVAWLSACAMPMKIIGNIPSPESALDAFFYSVCKGDFKEADQYLSGISISMKKPIEDSFSQKLNDYLLKSYSYSRDEKIDIEQLEAKCNVTFSYLDFNLLSPDLKAKATSLGKKYLAAADMNYVEKKDGAISITDEGAKKIAVEALDSILSEPEKYYSTKVFPVELKYSGSRWKLILTNELFDAICGGFSSATDE